MSEIHTREVISWSSASSRAKRWWLELEGANSTRPDLVTALANELARRMATLEDFFQICEYSNRVGVRENLRLLDLSRQDSGVRENFFDATSSPTLH